MLKAYRKQILGVAVTVIVLGIVIANLKFEEVFKAFSQANYLFLLPAVAITFIAYLLRAWRWQVILRPTKEVSFSSSYSVMMIGFMANNLLPARIGEFVRAYTMGSQEKISKSLSLATIVLERVCDGLTLVALMGFSLVVFPVPKADGWMQFIEIFSTAVFAGALIFLIFLIWREKAALKLISFLMKPLPNGLEHKAHGLLASFVLGLHALRNGSMVVKLVFSSLFIWLLEGCSYYLMLWAFNLQDKMSTYELIGAGLLLLVFVNLGTMIPSAPGFFGVYQLAATIALGAYNISNATAFSLALLTNTFQYVLVTAIGLFFFSRKHMSFKAIQQSKEQGDHEQEQESEVAAGELGLVVDGEAELAAHYSAADS